MSREYEGRLRESTYLGEKLDRLKNTYKNKISQFKTECNDSSLCSNPDFWIDKINKDFQNVMNVNKAVAPKITKNNKKLISGNDKYDFVPEDIIEFDGRVLCRIKAKRSIGEDVTVGDLGGYVEGLSNLDVNDESWIYDNSIAYRGAFITENSKLYHNSIAIHNTIKNKKYCSEITNNKYSIENPNI